MSAGHLQCHHNGALVLVELCALLRIYLEFDNRDFFLLAQ